MTRPPHKDWLGPFLLVVFGLMLAAVLVARHYERAPPDEMILIDEPDAPVIAAAAPSDDKPAGISLSKALTICRTTFFIDPGKGRAMFDALPAEDKPVVAALCLSYRQGAQDMLQVLKKETSDVRTRS